MASRAFACETCQGGLVQRVRTDGELCFGHAGTYLKLELRSNNVRLPYASTPPLRQLKPCGQVYDPLPRARSSLSAGSGKAGSAPSVPDDESLRVTVAGMVLAVIVELVETDG